MATKTCSKCGQVKDVAMFHKREGGIFGVRADCKICVSEKYKSSYQKNKDKICSRVAAYAEANKDKVRQYQKEYRARNKESIAAFQSAYREKNRERLIDQKKSYYQNNKHRHLKNCEQYREKNGDQIRAYFKRHYEKNRVRRILASTEYKRIKRRAKDPLFAASELARSMLYRVLKKTKQGKSGGSFELIGYTPEQLRHRIQSQFVEGMRWDNHGKWHIDHIIPVSEFISAGVTCPKRINALENLRPIWKEDNLSRRFPKCEKQKAIIKQLDPVAFIRAGI
jgi:hypothetical protein